MFDHPDEVRRAIQPFFAPETVECVADALVLAIVLHPTSSDRVGGTRMGGTPDVPKDFVWPRPVPPDDPEEIASRGNENAARGMREHMALGLPYAFIAQIDLAEAAALGAVASPLPGDGKLLFFYDFGVGPSEPGSRVARVIWEKSPRPSLVTSEMPTDLAASAARDCCFYSAPRRPKTLRSTLRLPDISSMEFDYLKSILDLDKVGMAEWMDFASRYQKALEVCHDDHSLESWRQQQLLGSPIPWSNDPREDWAYERGIRRPEETVREAREWQLLFQLGVADWRQESAEGSVYFLILREDLKTRRFDKVVACYQQS